MLIISLAWTPVEVEYEETALHSAYWREGDSAAICGYGHSLSSFCSMAGKHRPAVSVPRQGHSIHARSTCDSFDPLLKPFRHHAPEYLDTDVGQQAHHITIRLTIAIEVMMKSRDRFHLHGKWLQRKFAGAKEYASNMMQVTHRHGFTTPTPGGYLIYSPS
jgi:hypothetical protein